MTDDVKNYLNFDIGYTQSDESSFILFPRGKRNEPEKMKELPFNGRLNKVKNKVF